MARAGAMQFIAASLIAIAVCSAGPVLAHGGGLDKHGCHHDRKRGGYHCHGGASAPASRAIPDPYDVSPSRLAPSRFTPNPNSGVFANCSEARAAGAAPVRRGDPGYGPHLDRDGDGVGCEPRLR